MATQMSEVYPRRVKSPTNDFQGEFSLFANGVDGFFNRVKKEEEKVRAVPASAFLVVNFPKVETGSAPAIQKKIQPQFRTRVKELHILYSPSICCF